jgi:hypothetical protein
VSANTSLLNIPKEIKIYSPPCDQKKIEYIDQVDQKSKYINSILSKFEQRTNNKLMLNMKSRDAVTKSQEPVASRRNKFVLDGDLNEQPRQSFGEIRSLDRIAQILDKRSSIDDYKDKSRDWYLRKGRESQDKLSHKEVSQKYKDAFKNLSMELKKKIDLESRDPRHIESIDNKYLQVSSNGTD